MLHTTGRDRQSFERDVLGVSVRDFSRDQALALLNAAILSRTYLPVCFLNAHSANVSAADPGFRRVLRRFAVLPDGVGVDVAASLIHGAKFRANLNGTDFVPAFLRASPGPLKVGLVGGTPEVARKAPAAFSAIDDRHEYRSISHGYFDRDGNARILEDLAAWRPDVVLVAMGVPAQERWIGDNLDGSHCSVPIAVGALFDFVTGTVPRAPRWVRAVRAEWVYRLAGEPRRLWRRYLVGNPVFLARVMAEKLRMRERSPNA